MDRATTGAVGFAGFYRYVKTALSNFSCFILSVNEKTCAIIYRKTSVKETVRLK